MKKEICHSCGLEFTSQYTEEQELEFLNKYYYDIPEYDLVDVCDQCFSEMKEIMGWH